MSTPATDVVAVVLLITGILLLPLSASSNALLSLGETEAESLQANSIGSNSVGSSLGILNPSTDVAVLDGVSNLVVVDIVSDASLASEKSLLERSLELLGSGEESSDWDTVISESLVVGAGGEGGWDVSELRVVGEVILEELLDWAGSWRAGEVESASVSVVDGVDEVGGGDHVEVEVDGDLAELLWGQALDVLGGTDESDFFGGPEGEANGVVDGESSQLLGDLEESNDS